MLAGTCKAQSFDFNCGPTSLYVPVNWEQLVAWASTEASGESVEINGNIVTFLSKEGGYTFDIDGDLTNSEIQYVGGEGAWFNGTSEWILENELEKAVIYTTTQNTYSVKLTWTNKTISGFYFIGDISGNLSRGLSFGGHSPRYFNSGLIVDGESGKFHVTVHNGQYNYGYYSDIVIPSELDANGNLEIGINATGNNQGGIIITLTDE